MRVGPRAVTLTGALLAAVAAAVAVADPQSIAPSFDTLALQPGETRPGGDATSPSAAINANAFSHASGNLPFEREFDFKIGNGVFRKLWVSAPASTRSSDGLGPLYNARACQHCHLKDGRGHPPASETDDAVSMVLRLAVLDDGGRPVPEPVYGRQLQDHAVAGHRAEGRIVVTYEDIPVELAGGGIVHLRRPDYRIADPGYGPMRPDTMISPRVAPQMIGLGLLEAIPEDALLARADPDDADGDGISGRPNRVTDPETGRQVMGRFGWKAGQPSVRQQSAEAFANDIGLSSSLRDAPFGDCTPAQDRCRAAPHGADGDTAEVDDTLFELVAFYARNLAVPQRRRADDPDVLEGRRLFHESGCASCHTPSFVTGNGDDIEPELRNQRIWPYTDLLLHDMGEGLADGFVEGEATGREWRTPPLWGIGLTEAVNGHMQLLHDGRARGVLEAILWHGGEAEAAMQRVIAMTDEERRRLVAFVESL